MLRSSSLASMTASKKSAMSLYLSDYSVTLAMKTICSIRYLFNRNWPWKRKLSFWSCRRRFLSSNSKTMGTVSWWAKQCILFQQRNKWMNEGQSSKCWVVQTKSNPWTSEKNSKDWTKRKLIQPIWEQTWGSSACCWEFKEKIKKKRKLLLQLM